MTVDDLQAHLFAGADVNKRTEDGVTPLMWAAAFNENPAVIKALLDLGADDSLRDGVAETALDYAKENESLVGTSAYWRLNDARF